MTTQKPFSNVARDAVRLSLEHAGCAQVIFRTCRKHPNTRAVTRRYSAELEAAIRAGEMIDEEKFGLGPRTGTAAPQRPLRLHQQMRVS